MISIHASNKRVATIVKSIIQFEPFFISGELFIEAAFYLLTWQSNAPNTKFINPTTEKLIRGGGICTYKQVKIVAINRSCFWLGFVQLSININLQIASIIGSGNVRPLIGRDTGIRNNGWPSIYHISNSESYIRSLSFSVKSKQISVSGRAFSNDHSIFITLPIMLYPCMYGYGGFNNIQ